MNFSFSFIIPVFNRPDEIRELIESLKNQSYSESFEVVIIEDGSTNTSAEVVEGFQEHLNIAYYSKSNTGPGDSRNYGMQRANGNYFIILDSDCVLPGQYLNEVNSALTKSYVDFWGGPDAAHESFSMVQKAINYAMTAVLTTGGIRGNAKTVNKFQPRSFNMGISKKAFEASEGFGKIHPGEDPDLTIRLWKKGFESRFIPEAFVYHKRRIDWSKFYKQVHKFGTVRPILNKWHPSTTKVTYWFPSLFCMGFMSSLVFGFLGILMPLYLFAFYFGLIFVDSLVKNQSIAIAILSLVAVVIQFLGYGWGFLKASLKLMFSNQKAETLFPEVFFK